MSQRDGGERPPGTAARRGLVRRVGRYLPALVGLAVFVAALLVLRGALADTSLAEIVAGFRTIPASTLLAAVAVGVASYLVQTLYDLVGLRHVGSALRWRTIAPHAFCAMAVGHNVGVSALSGGAVRYRAYTALGLPVARVAAVIACYPVAYALGAATLLGLTLVLAPGTAPGGERLGEPILRLVGVALCAAPLVWLALARRAGRPFALGRLRLAPPAPPLALAQVAMNLPLGERNVTYRVLAGDAITERFTLTVRPRPRIMTFGKTITFPEYAGLPDQTTSEPHGDLIALAGSTVSLSLEPNQPIDRAELRLSPADPAAEPIVLPLTVASESESDSPARPAGAA